MSLIQFGIVGAGWRSEFYLRISQLIPNRFRVAGMVVRNEKNGTSIEKRWGIKTYRTVDEMLRHSDISFVIISISGDIWVFISKMQPFGRYRSNPQSSTDQTVRGTRQNPGR